MSAERDLELARERLDKAYKDRKDAEIEFARAQEQVDIIERALNWNGEVTLTTEEGVLVYHLIHKVFLHEYHAINDPSLVDLLEHKLKTNLSHVLESSRSILIDHSVSKSLIEMQARG